MARQTCELDHLVVTAPTLAAGAAWVESTLGVTLQAGGIHQRMGTHNALLSLGDSTYLEGIAVDPGAAQPDQPRWFELDRMSLDARPSLATWVARTENIKATTGHCREQFGRIEPMSRGVLNWLITIPPEGALYTGGVIPMLIEWGGEKHPATGLEDKGCALKRLDLFHPDVGWVTRVLDCLALGDGVAIHELPTGVRPYLVAHIETPQGTISIGRARDQHLRDMDEHQ